ncbi:MAG: CDP-glycerol glycerophosphotransferase family protein [Chitinophagales bacterium]|nr:CDP-glycerol glycerophosphotransferase family protein [Chitinophagales bacterium]
MQKKRIIMPISFSFSIRYIVRTGLLQQVQKLAEPIVVLTWKQQDLIDELKNNGVEVHILPPAEKGSNYLNLRKKIDYWFYHFCLKSPTRKNQVKYLRQYSSFKNNFKSYCREKYNILKMYMPNTIKKLFNEEKILLQTDTNFSSIRSWVKNLNASIVFTVTPFHSQEDILLRACDAEGMKKITAILSFDNITKRGWIPVKYDVYMVWNKYNYNELHRIYPYTKQKKIVITGAPQFDFYYNKKYLLNKSDWEKLVGIKNLQQRKIILYAGGPKSLFPNEPQYLKHIDEAINNGEIKGNPIVLFRCHPVDVLQRWKDVIGTSNNVVFDSSWTGTQNLLYANITNEDIMKLCSTLAYTDVHINLVSTMTVDGSVFNKPQIGPAYDEIAPNKANLLKGMYWQEHFIPIVKSGGLSLANSRKELIDLINQALCNPEPFIKLSQRIVEEIITYSDGQCTNRVMDVLKNELA